MNVPISNQITVHLDMNSFFATAEQQANPHLRGKPVGVCAYLEDHGCIIAASIEAKRCGMRVGMRVKEAREIVPNAIFVQNDPPKYRHIIKQVFALLDEVSDVVEPYSIDEAFTEMTAGYRDTAEVAFVMSRVMYRIRAEIGDWLQCSVGIAPNKLLAKLASDMRKPSGLTIIDRHNLDLTLQNIPLAEIWGVGYRTQQKLYRLGMVTALDVKHYPVSNLLALLGKQGYCLWAGLNGCAIGEVDAKETPPKSIGHSYCVPAHVYKEGKIVAVAMRLADRVAQRLRREKKVASIVHMQIGFASVGQVRSMWGIRGGDTLSLEHRFTEPTSDARTILSTIRELVKQSLTQEKRVNFLAITVHGLRDRRDTEPPRIFLCHDEHVEKTTHISEAIDLIRDRYGDQSIVFGDMIRLADEAPDRIGFRTVEKS